MSFDWNTVLLALVVTGLVAFLAWRVFTLRRRETGASKNLVGLQALGEAKRHLNEAEETVRSIDVPEFEEFQPEEKTQEEAMPTAEEDKIGRVEVAVREGWVTVKLEDLLASTQNIVDTQTLYRNSLHKWGLHVTDKWWQGLQPYTRAAVITHANYMRQVLDDKGIERLSRNVTTSSILFGFSVPRSLFILDEGVIERVLRYLVLTEPIRVDMDRVTFWEPYLPVPHLNHMVNTFLSSNTLMNTLFDHKRPPSAYVVHTLLVATMPMKVKLTLNQTRKILTCIYLAAGVSVPRDYVYIDMDVHDFVLRIGEHEEAPKVS